MTECKPEQLEFHALGKRPVVAAFDGGMISSGGGGLLLREAEVRTGILARLTEQFTDDRDPDAIEHTVLDLVGQRVYALALGYEDLNDHDRLRLDPLLAAVVGKADPSGADRLHPRDRGKALASSSTLNRLELTPEDAKADARYKKIVAHPAGMDALLVDCFLDAHPTAPRSIWIDLDATDDPLHGNQEGRFFHGYYGHYCYLPLYIFSGEHLLCARLRASDIDAAAGSVEELTRIVARIRARWGQVEIIIRGDSGFCRDDIMAWCEANDVQFVLGLAKNKRLLKQIAEAMGEAERLYQEHGQASRVFDDLRYRTVDSWSQERRVVAKAEHLAKGANPRFVVTSLPATRADARTLYEDLYCARGDMENRIKEQQLDLFADRTSSHTMRANQNRLYFSSFAYVLLCAVRRLGLQGTELARAQCGTIRLKLLKIGAQVRISVRRVRVSFSESFPGVELFRQALHNLRGGPPGVIAT
ncbi:IS1380 family transposase [uncultured Thiodictyon sp.]|uniref:IS1380 family transposase n=1 Tax=uncultured Thiodictyon sp. TaxID=1846217 RepID=UPI0025E645DC|nr:IS1380 family transposase [uncultured Thiodictyon sp.]